MTPPKRLVFTQVFEPTAGGAGPDDAEIVVSVTFEETEGRTRFVSRTVCPSQEVRDAILASGMEAGMRETMDLLEDLVATISR